MKSFYISVFLLAILLLTIVADSIYINKETVILIDRLHALPEPSDENYREQFSVIKKSWSKLKKLAKFSFPYAELTRIEIGFVELEARADADDVTDYNFAKSSLIFLLKELCRSEKIS